MNRIQIPPKFAAWFGLWTTLLLAIGGGTAMLPLGIPHDWIDTIKSWCVFLAFINGTVLTAAGAWSAPQAGPMATPPKQ